MNYQPSDHSGFPRKNELKFDVHFNIRVIFSVAKVSLLEVLRDRVLTQVLVFTFLLFLVSIVTAQVSPSVTARVLVDFSWGSLLLSCLVLSVFQGATALKRELERRTLFVIFGRPIYRFHWYLGKFFGLCGILSLNALLFSLLSEFLIGFLVDPASVRAGIGTRISADLLLMMQSWVTLSIALFFSTLTSAALAVALTFGVYLIGASHSQILWLSEQSTGVPQIIIRYFAKGFPNFEAFHLSKNLTYGVAVDAGSVLSRCGYGFLWCAIFLVLGGLILRRREF